MARIRTIKPSFWSDSAVSDLSMPARLLLIGLISSADDEGRFVGTHSAITGYVFPHDTIPTAKLRSWLKEVEQAGIVTFYTVNRREYGCFPNWKKHQKINRPQPSTLPPPNSVNGSVNRSMNGSLSAQ